MVRQWLAGWADGETVALPGGLMVRQWLAGWADGETVARRVA